MNQSINQSIIQSIDQSTRSPTNPSIHQSTTQPIAQTGGWDESSRRHGRGSFVEAATGARYDGEWRRDRRHGTGIFTGGGGGVATAATMSSQGGSSHTHGKHSTQNNHSGGGLGGGSDFIYDGQWVSDERSGFGRAVWADRGESYSGEVSDDRASIHQSQNHRINRRVNPETRTSINLSSNE